MSDDYGVSGIFNCWIKTRQDLHGREIFFRLFEFYIPLWIAILFNFFVFMKVSFSMKKMFGNQRLMKTVGRLKFYPVFNSLYY